mmetsp:Transcript_102593/g.208954  ORF Transcript_102593/g.208954 Transcript_102593/m.208954 type:complete len:299 (+) Transcript_102593:42-938(+)|eukprot:CAMPEP_0201134468 /NCGR_PEP_ID=MMETSP0850-20130426/51691_1 /ASSEMBLY_ACC=CAM_ASM_000622 /TAXON_ID=183588 /ORGANISM="Pseudo-nitzschia fraudulenta, Strain WWA7" /LENGTH=298 /DNA_ID=CAMNT_0047405359 /DNA_START=47 /DNA_END=943 /DNA_ORIENTATION=+
MYDSNMSDINTMYRRKQQNGKVVIVDYDDTILPSTFVDRWKIEKSSDLPQHFQNMLDELSRCTKKFLEEASKYGEVIIITNSDEGWVQFSAERYCPALLPVLAKYPIVSARTRYEKFYPCQPLCWKAAAFAHEVNEIYDSLKNADDSTSCASMEGTEVSSTSSLSESSLIEDDLNNQSSPTCVVERSDQPPRQIISFGDSNEERMAVSIVSGQLDAVPKSIKFMGSPSLLQIIGQLYLLTNHMRFVCESTKSLDMHITREQADQYAQSYLRDENVMYDDTIVPSYVPRSRKGLNACSR